ncbi:MAG: hypothetical protein KDD60_10185 [Bdellovibrionales bacterium]|nr:hypothetical protein [Bdellovibrionales bacterium]
MIRFLLTLAASWSVSSWVFSEVYFFVPEVEPYVNAVERIIAIPRHDQWRPERFVSEIERIEVLLGDVEFASASLSFRPNVFGKFAMLVASSNSDAVEIMEESLLEAF